MIQNAQWRLRMVHDGSEWFMMVDKVDAGDDS